MNFEDFNVIVENELFGVVVVIEVVVRKFVEFKFKLCFKVKLYEYIFYMGFEYFKDFIDRKLVF